MVVYWRMWSYRGLLEGGWLWRILIVRQFIEVNCSEVGYLQIIIVVRQGYGGLLKGGGFMKVRQKEEGYGGLLQ